MRSLLLVLSFSLFATLSVPARDAIFVKVSPQIGFAPLTVRAQVHIEREKDNRAACLIFGDFTSTCWQLDGTDSPITFWKEFRDLPADDYDVFVVVEQTMGRLTQSAHVPVQSISAQQRVQ